MDVYHECSGRSGLVKLEPSRHKIPYRGPIEEYGLPSIDWLKPAGVKYWQPYICAGCPHPTVYELVDGS